MIGKKTFFAAVTAIAALGFTAQAAQAAPAVPNGMVTLTRADNSTVTVPWQAGPNGSWYAVDPQNKNKSNGIENAAIKLRPASPQESCFSGEVCIYQDGNWIGWELAFPAGSYSYHLGLEYACPGCHSTHHPDSDGTWSDQLSSWKNFSGIRYCWSFDSGGTGETHFMNNGDAVAQVTGHENDEATSLFPC
ncbi:hypothetical protein ACFQ1S_02625 [Kibdelosporangium lantanae]|uniref:Uncharacterized protein n=1 Tax=Kibdelosporangium lantanae TaxID=1497396 RepID=A0ABW3M4Q4_9PSEU